MEYEFWVQEFYVNYSALGSSNVLYVMDLSYNELQGVSKVKASNKYIETNRSGVF